MKDRKKKCWYCDKKKSVEGSHKMAYPASKTGKYYFICKECNEIHHPEYRVPVNYTQKEKDFREQVSGFGFARSTYGIIK